MRFKLKYFLILFLLFVFFTRSKETLILLICAAIHEFGHIIAAYLLGIRFNELSIGLSGARLKTKNNLFSYRSEIILSLAGPLANLVTFFLTISTRSQITEINNTFIYASLFLAILNLLPIMDFDGGRTLYALLSEIFSPMVANKALSFTSFVIIFILWSFSLFLLILYDYSISLFVFSVSLFINLFLKK